MSKAKVAASYLFCSVLLMVGPALAYVGPGAGITMLGALWGVLVAIVLALGAVFYLPIRTMLRKRRQRRPDAVTGAPPAAGKTSDGRS
jgi:heme O synthase-like polyprenyltransferase